MSGRTATRGRHRTDHSTPERLDGEAATWDPPNGRRIPDSALEAQSACPSRDAYHRTVTRCCVVAVTQLRGVRATGTPRRLLVARRRAAGRQGADLWGSGPFASRAATLSGSARPAPTL